MRPLDRKKDGGRPAPADGALGSRINLRMVGDLGDLGSQIAPARAGANMLRRVGRAGITFALTARWRDVLAVCVIVLRVLRHGMPLPGWFRL